MSTTTVDLEEAQHRLADLIALAQAGNEVVVAQGDIPVARIVAVTTEEPALRIAGLNRGAMQMSDDFNAPLPDEFWLGAA
jgi:antitoxin (DNA-binding transcriptional repressor) of toxin-antitoxin stability system